MTCLRIIPRLEIKGPDLVKGVQLEGLRVLGKPMWFAQKYYEEGADELIYLDMVASLYGRNSLLEFISNTARKLFIPLTIGGGITGDVGGFASNLYKRGLNLVNIPTTLLSQVDSSIGGKTGVNTKEGKNLIGSFYQPKMVLSDIEFLKSENIQNVDSFICVTENEKTNLIAGLLARHLGAKQSIIHVSTTEYIPTIQEIGAGAVISKNLSTVNAILRELHTDMTEIPVVTFDEIDVDVIEFQPEPNSPVTQRPLKDLNLPKDCIVGMINHHGKIRIAHGTSILSEDDTALVFAKPKAVSKLKKLFLKCGLSPFLIRLSHFFQY